MATTTSVYGWRIPVLGDDPNIPSDITNLADDVEAALSQDYSLRLTGANVRLTESATTNILTSTFTLTAPAVLNVAASVRTINSGADALLGITIIVDGTFSSERCAGPVAVFASGVSAILDIPLRQVGLAAGAHTITLQADRNANGVVDATGTTTFGVGSRSYKATSLTIIG